MGADQVTATRPLVHRVPAKKQRPARAAKRKQTPRGTLHTQLFSFLRVINVILYSLVNMFVLFVFKRKKGILLLEIDTLVTFFFFLVNIVLPNVLDFSFSSYYAVVLRVVYKRELPVDSIWRP